jgi:hypothetical protein
MIVKPRRLTWAQHEVRMGKTRTHAFFLDFAGKTRSKVEEDMEG